MDDTLTQLYRDEFYHYLDTTPTGTDRTWKREGTGVESLAMSFNPQVDQYKTILYRTADATFNNYQISSSVSKRIYKGDPCYEYIDAARRNATAIETNLLEIDSAYATGTTSVAYQAIQYRVLITIDEFLGENATISYNINVKGAPTVGTATITSGVPTFTPAA